MFRNYLAAALRNLVRNRLYAAINIVGLAVGFAAALLIALFVRDEFSYDRFFPDYRQIYLLGSEYTLPGRAKEYPDSTPAELAPLLKADFFGVAAIARIASANISFRHGAVESVWRGGRKWVSGGRHVAAESVAARYLATVAALLA